ncbi:WAT1-related protein At1g68170-like [Chenopodium quinoa]|uniref:WAT1-related protein At1g68170-like n=1 Tax=Chenopodium quinoa TaxID=63459 RepID=UPI000B795AF9|nr:WAT1-related protein At1g68170-like [Chenopodium quinoa]
MVQFWQFINDIKSIIIMVIVQIAFAGVNITYKLAAVDGMNLRVLVAYRILFAAVFMVPIAYFLERETRPKLTWTILGQAVLYGLFGSLVHNLFLESLVLTSATINAAMLNLIPAVTFILAVFFRLEKVSLKTLPGTAKVMGTVLGILGAMVLTLYKGFEIKIGSPNTHLMKGAAHGHGPGVHDARDHLIGSVFAVCGCCCYASWLIVQVLITSLISCIIFFCFLCLEHSYAINWGDALVFALCMDRDLKSWKLGWNIRLLTIAGIVASGVMVTLVAWCIRLKGPLFVSIFNPLRVIIVAFAGYLFLDEKLYLGSVLGAILIVIGLYGVVWGKGKEIKKKAKLVPSINCEDSTKDIEIITSSVLDEGNKASKDNVMNNASTRPKCAAKEDDDHSLPNDDIVVDAQGKSKRVDGIS